MRNVRKTGEHPPRQALPDASREGNLVLIEGGIYYYCSHCTQPQLDRQANIDFAYHLNCYIIDLQLKSKGNSNLDLHNLPSRHISSLLKKASF